jgi:hypothetical protein
MQPEMPTAPATLILKAASRRLFPVRIETGDYLAVMPPSYPDNLWVLAGQDMQVIRRAYFDEGKLWSVLADEMENGHFTLLHSPRFQLIQHLLQTAQLSPRQALRVLQRVG